MTVAQIVIDYLKAHGQDGLCTYGCGCSLEDLFCCSNPSEDCVPGYRQYHSPSNPDPDGECNGVNCNCIGAVPPCAYCREGLPLLKDELGRTFHPVNTDTGHGVTGFSHYCPPLPTAPKGEGE